MSNEAIVGRCKDCLWWDVDRTAFSREVGDVIAPCRVAPPIFREEGNSLLTSVWPTTTEADWCSRFTKR